MTRAAVNRPNATRPKATRQVATRYKGTLVALHWLVAVMIIGLLCLGYFVLANMPDTDPKKLDILVLHMSGGILVLALMVVRTIVRLRSVTPAPALTGSRVVDRLTPISHFAFYVIVFLMIASGWTIGFMIRGAFGPGGRLPNSFAVLPPFQVHAALAALLATLIGGHVAATLYQQFVLKHALFGRMWFGPRTILQANERREARTRSSPPSAALTGH